MNAVVDASSLISLAWSGALWLIAKAPVDLHLPTPVRDEVVVTGLARGYADAATIQANIEDLPLVDVEVASTVDAAVLEASTNVGALVCNDIALGRRASNLGVVWLRTADLVVLTVRSRSVPKARGRDVLTALRDAGRITDELLTEYAEELS